MTTPDTNDHDDDNFFGSDYMSPPILKRARKYCQQEDGSSIENDDEDENEKNLQQRIRLDASLYDKQRTNDDDHDADESFKEEEEEEEVEAIVSILNVVVDYVMSQPTPFEPEEFKWKRLQQSRKNEANSGNNIGVDGDDHGNDDDPDDENGNFSQVFNEKNIDESDEDDDDDDDVQVPIVRIFGPIVKGGRFGENGSTSISNGNDNNNDNSCQPSNNLNVPSGVQKKIKKHNQYHQSGCLHIHGAYPYMLARPVKAGPDGSSFFFGNDNENHDNKQKSGGKGKEEYIDYFNENIDWDDQESVSTIIEDIHVQLESSLRSSVEDYRNDYTKIGEDGNKQMSGETEARTIPIRFIRKITVVRGRGFYTYCIGTAAPFLRIEYYNPANRWRVKAMLERGLDMPLSFHPGRTSFDQQGGNNNDIDLDILKFRCYEAHIPYTMQFFKDWNLAGMAWIHIGDVRFRNPLSRAGKMRYTIKEDGHRGISKTSFDSNHLFVKNNVPSKFQWTKKGEPQNGEKTESAMDEFWTRKETSCDVELDTIVSNILNVNEVMTRLPSQSEEEIHWRAVPSLREIWAEERQRMASLLPPKDNFLSGDNGDLSFTLSVKKGAPVPGYKLAFDGNRRLFGSNPTLENDFRRAMKDIMNKYESKIDQIDLQLSEKKAKNKALSVASNKKNKKKQENLLTILSQKDEALSALEGLFGQFSKASQNHAITTQDSPRVDDSTFSTLLLSPLKNNRLSQLVPHATLLTQVDREEVQDNLEFCMGVDCEDFGSIKEIDPTSLTPFDDRDKDNFLDEEEGMGEEEFEKSLTTLATQKSEPTRESLSQLNAVVNTWSASQRNTTFDEFVLGQESVSSEDQVQIKSMSPNIKEYNYSTPPVPRKMLSLLSSNSPSINIKNGDVLELKEHPPTRSGFDRSPTHLYPNNLNPMASVSWLGFVSTMHQSSSIPYNHDFLTGSFLQPIRGPPSSSQVSKWVERKRRKSKPSKKSRNQLKKVKRKIKDPLKINSSSSKFKVQKLKRKRQVAFADETHIPSSTVCLVEEVRWIEGSQDLTQESSTTTSSQEKQIDGAMNLEKKLTTPSPTDNSEQSHSYTNSTITQISPFSNHSDSSHATDPLQGIGQQGGKIYVEGGGLKASVIIDKSRLENKLSIMSIEVHIQCRMGKAGAHDSTEIAMKPDPSRDSIFAVCYVYAIDPGGGEKIEIKERGCVFIPTQNEISSFKDSEDTKETSHLISKIGKTMGITSEMKLEVAANEKELLLRISSIVQWKDPDVLMSWDTQGGGLGYLVERGSAVGRKESDDGKVSKINMVRLLGRTPKNKAKEHEDHESIHSAASKGTNQWTGSALGAEWDNRVGAGAGPSSIVGRLILNAWKIMSDEVKHPNASYLPAMVATVLKKRIPHHEDLVLTRWYGGNKGIDRWRVLKYRIVQAVSSILLFDALDVIGRAGEAARLSGVEFSQSFPGIRGSQYKVEGVVLRSLQSLVLDGQGEERNYFFFSPSKNDCGNQEALECQAMTLEPQSGFHFDPIVVCDFTALYPSLVIAYNLCYSTIAGKLEYHSTRSEMLRKGTTTQKLGPYDYDEARTAFVLKHHMKSLSSKDGQQNNVPDRAYCMPTGSIFVSEDVMKGVLPNLLDEMLSTRAMLKKAAKIYRKHLPDPPAAVLRQLEARQLALKYVANVTYGYTSATFSGRSAMPLLADTIVECGRRTLSNAIALATKWGAEKKGRYFGAEVVYGDSVIGSTPLVLRVDGRIIVRRIETLATKWSAYHNGKESCELVGVESWTDKGWTPVQRIIRHLCTKKLAHVQTHTGNVVCTTDHSLISVSGEEVTPRNLCIDDELMHDCPTDFPAIQHQWQVSIHKKLVGPEGQMYDSLREAAIHLNCHVANVTRKCEWRLTNETIYYSPQLAQLLGIFIGNGSCGHYQSKSGKRSYWVIRNGKRRVIKEYQQIANNIFPGFEWEILPMTKSLKVYKLVPKSSKHSNIERLVVFWRNLCYNDKCEKKINDCVLQSSEKHRKSFWKGLHDASGTNKSNKPDISQKGAEISLSIVILLRSLGYANIIIDTTSENPNIFRMRARQQSRKSYNGVKKISDWHREETFVYDLTTENHHFHAGVGTMIVHNTDSLFIKLPGRSVNEAFAFGKEFCDSVTASNPPPVQLKLEKVYGATLLQTKKKYCGMKYESPGQKVPTFEAKGIETIRKDQCALTQKVLRNALVTVFRDRGLHGLQEYLFRQWALIHAGRLPVSDFILTGRVRSQYRGKVGPVQAALARRLAEADPGRIVQHKERLAYVIVAAPGRNFKLRDCVLTPNELLTQWDSYTIHAAYYITRHVNAALNRCFGLPPWNINIHNWYDACPKPQKRIHHWPMTRTGGSPMISAFFGSDQCAICGKKCKTDGNAKAVICPNCKGDQGSAVFLAVQTLSSIQQKANKLASLCKNCNGCFENSGTFAVEKKSIQSKKVNSVRLISTKSVSGGLESPLSNCTCIDCPITYKRHEMRESEIEALALCKALRAFDD